MFSTSVLGEKLKNKKVVGAGVPLSEACALSENHPLSEALSLLSESGESEGESVKHLCVISSLSKLFVFSRAKRSQCAQWKITCSRLARKWR